MFGSEEEPSRNICESCHSYCISEIVILEKSRELTMELAYANGYFFLSLCNAIKTGVQNSDELLKMNALWCIMVKLVR